jgi:hypothetical protein
MAPTRRTIGEDADDVGAALDLAIEPRRDPSQRNARGGERRDTRCGQENDTPHRS